MENTINKNKNIEIINEIEKIRRKNNKCWMDLLRLAFKLDSEKAQRIFKKIIDNDNRINELSKKLI